MGNKLLYPGLSIGRCGYSVVRTRQSEAFMRLAEEEEEIRKSIKHTQEVRFCQVSTVVLLIGPSTVVPVLLLILINAKCSLYRFLFSF